MRDLNNWPNQIGVSIQYIDYDLLELHIRDFDNQESIRIQLGSQALSRLADLIRDILCH